MFHSALSALTFSSGEFLTITESRGLSGAWSWVLAGGEQIWSPGFFAFSGSSRMPPRRITTSS